MRALEWHDNVIACVKMSEAVFLLPQTALRWLDSATDAVLEFDVSVPSLVFPKDFSTIHTRRILFYDADGCVVGEAPLLRVEPSFWLKLFILNGPSGIEIRPEENVLKLIIPQHEWQTNVEWDAIELDLAYDFNALSVVDFTASQPDGTVWIGSENETVYLFGASQWASVLNRGAWFSDAPVVFEEEIELLKKHNLEVPDLGGGV